MTVKSILKGFALVLLGGVAFSVGAPAAVAPTPFGVQAAGPGLKQYHFTTAATTNSTSVVGVPAATLYAVYAVNTTATAEYLKFYNLAAAPTCGTSAVALTVQLPAGVTTLFSPTDYGVTFPLGMGFCVTGAVTDTDTTASVAGVVFTLMYN